MSELEIGRSSVALDRAAEFREIFDLLSEDDLAVTLGVTVQTLATWRSERQGPDYVKLGKSVFYRVDDIVEWIDRNIISLSNLPRLVPVAT